MFSLCESAWVCMCLHVYTTWMFYWDVAVWETSKTSRRPALNHLNTRFISRGAKVVRDATNKTQLKWINHDVREACVLKSHERPLKVLKIDESVNQICCNLLLRWLTLHKCLPMRPNLFSGDLMKVNTVTVSDNMWVLLPSGAGLTFAMATNSKADFVNI